MQGLVLSAGMPRSGSTWLYNAARLLLQDTVADPADFSAGWIRDLAAKPATPLQLVKVHAYDRGLARRAAVVLYSYRDVRDAVASRARMTGEAQVAGEATHYVKHDRRWRKVADYVMRYESMRADPDRALRDLAAALGAATVDTPKLRARLETLEQAESKRESGYDRQNLLHARHITHGGHGSWVGSLSPEVVAEIELRHHRWLRENDYPVTTIPHSAVDRLRWLWWSVAG
jgi:hypothetical protein